MSANNMITQILSVTSANPLLERLLDHFLGAPLLQLVTRERTR